MKSLKPYPRQIMQQLIQAGRDCPLLSLPCFWGALEGSRVLFLSPHPDDLGLCFGGIMADMNDCCRFTVLDFFTRTTYAPEMELREAEEISFLRSMEELCYCRRYGVNLEMLPWPDSSLRGYTNESAMQGIRSGDPSWAMEVGADLEKTLAKSAPDIIFCPLGIGNHVDHLIVLRLLKRMKHDGALIIYYEDLPYALGLKPKTIERIILERMASPFSLSVDITTTVTEKLDALGIFRGTLSAGEIRSVADYAARIAFEEGLYIERLWLSLKG